MKWNMSETQTFEYTEYKGKIVVGPEWLFSQDLAVYIT